ncbi:EVE domain-containing protein [Mycolicibacterium confluentis]|uniref:UPF0310 protein MCNF_52090 n=1 Tax=Mycolicibacterium confluentis TaxID=28047 RepID=A0A7I7Y5N5_9MYCO|nr:EVE domain-containing protein [Mycolicibacterium confluentis]MCV7318994.1 EVE domain-containing protein [Mycolicibacterium confluentis]ORV28828.1 EVE domain-containing protein [Mycolicibacterium confluentis]BBZ36604.1 UPF0310 protein [Mycolicibacterium confluentis]
MTAWINTVGRDHVLRGVAGGFTQSDHGTPDRLRRLVRDDWVAFYSPRTDHPDGAPLQAFTALGRIVDDEPFQVQMTEGFHPFRRRMEFLDCTETPIRPLLDGLGFIEDKKRWGYRFRFGLFRIPDADFALIRSAMTAVPPS